MYEYFELLQVNHFLKSFFGLIKMKILIQLSICNIDRRTKYVLYVYDNSGKVKLILPHMTRLKMYLDKVIKSIKISKIRILSKKKMIIVWNVLEEIMPNVFCLSK